FTDPLRASLHPGTSWPAGYEFTTFAAWRLSIFGYRPAIFGFRPAFNPPRPLIFVIRLRRMGEIANVWPSAIASCSLAASTLPRCSARLRTIPTGSAAPQLAPLFAGQPLAGWLLFASSGVRQRAYRRT